MKLCIAEKPSVAREIARVLGAQRREDGYFRSDKYCVTWTFGHFCQLKEPGDYEERWKRWTRDSLPIAPAVFDTKLMDDKGINKQFSIIRTLVREAEEIINCGDAGQEGELIQRWVLKEAGNTKPVKRLWISSLTDSAIRDGFRSLRDAAEFDNLYRAGESRAIGDWLLGMNATRLYTLAYRSGQGVLSVGRVQTPTLALIVGRQREIDSFKPEPYWELKSTYRDTQFDYAKGRFDKEEKARDVLQAVENKEFEIRDVEIKEGREKAPKLFDLTTLQVECNRRFSLSAENTLKIAQQLYEKKFITYPRVDTQFLPNDIFPKLEGILKGLRGHEEFTAPLLEAPLAKRKSMFNDGKITDHHAIVPTGQTTGALEGLEHKVFELIARRFIAALYPDCRVSRTRVNGLCSGHEFQAKGKTILDPGWRVVYQPERDSGQADEEQVLPQFVVGERGSHTPEIVKKMTKAPNSYTEASLLRAMETAGKSVDDEELRNLMKENGLGRPSTRAAIIETLFKRKYIERQRKRIAPTPTGMRLIELIRDSTLKSAELTGQWERKLRLIENGEYTPEEFLESMNTKIREIIAGVDKDAESSGQQLPEGPETGDVPVPEPNFGPCPKCERGVIIEGKKGYGCHLWRFGCRFTLWKTVAGKTLTEKQIKELLKNGQTGLIKGFKSKDKKKTFDAVLGLDDKHALVFDFAAADAARSLGTCPKCKEGRIIEGRKGYGCTRWKEGCEFTIWKEIAGKKLTKKQVKSLIDKGRTDTIKGFSSKAKQKNFDAALRIDKDYRVVFSFGN